MPGNVNGRHNGGFGFGGGNGRNLLFNGIGGFGARPVILGMAGLPLLGALRGFGRRCARRAARVERRGCGGCGCGTFLLVVVVLTLACFFLFGYRGYAGSIEEYVKDPLAPEYCTATELYIECDGVEAPGAAAQDAMEYFFGQTGVQPRLLLKKDLNGTVSPDWEDVDEFLFTAYEERFEDEGHLLVLMLTDGGDFPLFTEFYSGFDASDVMDAEGCEALRECLNRAAEAMPEATLTEILTEGFRNAASEVMVAHIYVLDPDFLTDTGPDNGEVFFYLLAFPVIIGIAVAASVKKENDKKEAEWRAQSLQSEFARREDARTREIVREEISRQPVRTRYPITCPGCGATAYPNEDGTCQYCGRTIV